MSAVGDLRALAERYVTLTGEVEDVRRAMLACLTNGAGESPVVRPTSARSKPGEKGSRSKHPNAQLAAEAEGQILDLLKTRPMRMAEIASEMGAKQTTTTERLRRLRERGQIVPADGGGWAVAP
jgi:DNA-binding NtrC family response regulator